MRFSPRRRWVRAAALTRRPWEQCGIPRSFRKHEARSDSTRSPRAATSTEVKLPPHLTGQIVFAIRPGDAVSIRGLRARAIPLIDATAIANVATGKSVVDNGPPGGDRDRGGDAQAVSGRIASTLHGKRGEVNGALLEDGTMLRLPPPEAERFEGWLRPGQMVSVRGDMLDIALGRVIDVRALGSSPDQMTELTGPRPPRGPKGGPDRLVPPPPPPGFGPPAPPRG
jgi:hypothetical protein